MTHFKFYFSKILLLLTLLSSGFAYADIHIVMNSDAGDYIGQGQHFDLTDTTDGVKLEDHSTYLNLYTANPGYWGWFFSAPKELTAMPYFSAIRIPGPVHNGIDVYGLSRGCNDVNGYFVIYELHRVNGVIKTLALDFVQHCEAANAALRGSIRMNSSIPIPYPNPVTNAGPDRAVMESATVLLDGTESAPGNNADLKFNWQQISGPPVVLSYPHHPKTSFMTPADVKLDGENLVFKLSVTDGLNQSSTDTISIHVRSKSDPFTSVYFTGTGGDYISGDIARSFNTYNAQILATKNDYKGVSIGIQGAENWNIDFAAPNKALLAVGNFPHATRFPFEPHDVAGFSVYGDGRGCNQSTDSFIIKQLVWNGNTIKHFAATYVQHCENGTSKLTGNVSFNALDPSVPVANAGTNQTVVEATLVTLNGSGSYDTDGAIKNYHWTQTGGIPVSLSNAFDIRPNFMTPHLADRQNTETLTFQLLITDDQGFKAKSHVSIIVQSSNIAPLAHDDTSSTGVNKPVDILVLGNDSDSDGTINASSVTIGTIAAHGQTSVNATGIVTYIPNAGFVGNDSFTYTVSDNDGAVSNSASVSISVH